MKRKQGDLEQKRMPLWANNAPRRERLLPGAVYIARYITPKHAENAGSYPYCHYLPDRSLTRIEKKMQRLWNPSHHCQNCHVLVSYSILVLFTAMSVSGNSAPSVGTSGELTVLTRRRSCVRGTLPEFAWRDWRTY